MTSPNLARWIKASVSKHINTLLANAYHLHVDGFKDETTTKDAWYELYVLGPDFTRHTRNCTHHYVEVLVGCISKITTDAHVDARMKGMMQSILDRDICLYKLGATTGPGGSTDNDQSLFGHLTLRSDVQRAIDGMDYGIVSHRDLQVKRCTVEAKYETFLP